MKILLDTNFLYSAIFHPSREFDAIIEFLFLQGYALIPRYVAHELIAKAEEKRPEAAELVHAFLDFADPAVVEDVTSTNTIQEMRDKKDQPILDSAIAYGVDILISGDKHFQALNIDSPRIMSPRQFIDEFLPE